MIKIKKEIIASNIIISKLPKIENKMNNKKKITINKIKNEFLKKENKLPNIESESPIEIVSIIDKSYDGF